MKKKIDEYLPIVLLYGLCAYFLFDTKDFTEDSLFYPRGLVWILLILVTIMLFMTVLKKIKLPKEDEDNVPRKFWTILCMSVVYVFAVPHLGFTLSSLIYCPSTALILGYKSKSKALLVSFIVVALIYVSFKWLLKVPIPTLTVFGLTL